MSRPSGTSLTPCALVLLAQILLIKQQGVVAPISTILRAVTLVTIPYMADVGVAYCILQRSQVVTVDGWHSHGATGQSVGRRV